MSSAKTYSDHSIDSLKKYGLLLFAAALALRVICAWTYRGFESDTACFYSWACSLWKNGFGTFYSPDYFCDYPPGYLYILYLLGGLIDLFNMTTLTGPCLLILKLPAILADMAAGWLIYAFGRKHLKPSAALLLSACYLFHPAVFINSSLWGQVDAVFTLLLLACCILLSSRKNIPAYFLFAVCLLVKPQALIFAPLILCNVAEQVWQRRPTLEILKNLAGGVASILSLLLLSLPFGPDKVWAQYTETLSSYPYAAVNTFNLWGLFGKNWVSQDTKLGTLTYNQWGTVFIILITFASFLIFYMMRKRGDRYYVTGAFLITSVFLFAVRMHERYLFPVMLLLLFAYIHNQESAYLKTFAVLSICHFCNVFWVLYCYDPTAYDRKASAILLISFMTLAGGLGLFRTIFRSISGAETSLQKGFFTSVPAPSEKSMSFTKADLGIIVSLSLFYGIFAFTNLGVTKAPETECAFPYNTYLEFHASEGQEISNLYWYLLNEQDITCSLEVQHSGDATWTYLQNIELADVFEWEYLNLSTPVTAVRITNITEDAVIGELVFTNAEGSFVTVAEETDYYPLFDERDTFPDTVDAQSTTYFDEIYYTRTVYEFMHGLPSYENTHPPFGKILLTLGVLLFGTTPFGFRFMGALFGVLMLPFLYLLGRNLTKSREVGAFVTFLFAFDFMHFAQTRLATIDVFIVFFIILMYYFMERYCSMSFYDTDFKKTLLPLGACGITFGFGIATKWTGAYAGAGLAIIFFLHLWKRFREYRYALQQPEGASSGISHKYIVEHFGECTIRTIGFCLIFFVSIPFLIYLLSYIPFEDGVHSGLFEKMISNQETMFNYHSNLTATHPYSSLWYEWPVMSRPIFYYSNQLTGNLRQGISSFGNPLVWWAGIPAFLYTAYMAVYKKNKTAGFLTISYLAQYLPWVLVDRCTFIYHYFPSVPFVALMIGFCFMQLKKHMHPMGFGGCLIAYAGFAFALFLMFYPVLAGTTVTTEYVAQFLRWFDSWVLILN